MPSPDPNQSTFVARNGAVIFRFRRPGLLALTGEDRVRFLNGMITQDVKALGGGAGKYSLLCNAKGKILADLYVWSASDHLLLECEEGLVEKIHATLDRFIIADDVVIEDWTGQAELLHMAGKSAAAVLDKTGLSVPEEPLRRAPTHLGGTPLLLARNDRTGLPGYDFWCESAGSADTLINALEAASAQSAPEESFHLLRFESGIPRYGVDFGEDNLPQEADLKHAFSTTKGCYTGQEVICKIESFAHVNKHLLGFEIEGGSPPPQAKLLSKGTEIGSITQAHSSPATAKSWALGYVRHKALEDGTDLLALDVQWQGGTARARKVELPFINASARS